MADRLAPLSADEKTFQSTGLGFRQQAVGIGDDVGASDTRRRLDDQARIDDGTIDASRLEAALGRAPGGDQAGRRPRGALLQANLWARPLHR
jgi:hypothetical protein